MNSESTQPIIVSCPNYNQFQCNRKTYPEINPINLEGQRIETQKGVSLGSVNSSMSGIITVCFPPLIYEFKKHLFLRPENGKIHTYKHKCVVTESREENKTYGGLMIMVGGRMREEDRKSGEEEESEHGGDEDPVREEVAKAGGGSAAPDCNCHRV